MANSSRIKGITIEIDGDSTKLQDAIKGANTAIRSSQAQLKDLNKLLKLDPGNTELLKQKYSTLGKEIDDTKRKLDTLKQAEQQMNSAGQTDTAEWDALQREIAETEQNLKSLTDEYKSFGSVAAQQVAVAGEKVKEFGSKVESTGKTLTTHVTLPLTAAGAAGVASFAEVDKTMQLANKTMGNTADEAENLNSAMKEAAANSTYGMSDAATATLNFARAGLDAEQSAAALAPAMNLAAGEGGNLDTVSAGLVATINGFHGAFSDAGKYADVFASACNNSALDVDSLSGAMSVAAPIFSAAGYAVEDAALYMGVMANNGIEADKAANSLKTGIARLVSPAKEGAEKMAELCISVTNADGTMKDSITVQQDLHNAFSKLSESEQLAAASAIFGKNQMAPWLALINTAPGDVAAMDSSLRNCSGTTQEMADTMMGGFGGSIEKLKSSIDVLVYSLGQALAPTISQIVNFVQGLVDKFNALSSTQQDLIVKIALTAAAIGPLLVVLGKLTSSVGSIMTWAPKIVSGISTIGGGLSKLWGILSAHPIALVIAAVAALVVAVAANWDKIYSWTVEKFTAVKDWLANTWDEIRGSISEKLSNIFASVSEKWTEIKASISEKVTGALQTVQQKFEAIRSNVSEKLSGALQSAREKWEAIKSGISEKAAGALQTVRDKFEAIRSSIGEKLTAAKSAAANIFDSIKEGIRSKIEGARDLVRSAVEKIKSFFNFSWSLPKIKLPHFSISGSFSLNPPSIPHIGVSWYKKAMDNAMVLDRATIFGAAGGQLLGGGEAGREVISGESHLLDMINASVDSAIGQRMDSVLGLLEQYLPGCAQTKVALPVSSLSRALAQQTVREAGGW